MLLNKKELEERIELMGILGISSAQQDYFIQSANDEEHEDIIQLIDIISSKAMAIAVASGNEMRSAVEQHLEARRKLIEEIKKLDGRQVEEDYFCLPEV